MRVLQLVAPAQTESTHCLDDECACPPMVFNDKDLGLTY